MNNRAGQETVYQAIEQLQKLSELFQHRRLQLARRVGLTEQQWRVLEEVSTEHFVPSMFARNRDSSPAAVSKIIRQLGEKQLIRGAISRIDGRQRHYVLTAKGRRLMEEIRTHRLRAIQAIWLGLDLKQLNQFVRFSRRLIASLASYSGKEQ